jgi:predicted dehydrogenase
MSRRKTSRAADEPARLALVCDAEGAEVLSAALAGLPINVVGQSGRRPFTGLPKIQWYDDARIMLAQSGAEGLLVATSTREAVELAELAAEHELAIWRMAPVARTFAEATEVVTRCRQRGLVYRVASWWEAVADEVRAALSFGEGVKPAFSHVRVSAAGPSMQSWRANAAEASGGVLASEAYDMLEALVAVRGLPERISAIVANVRRRPGELPRETEDVATALLRYQAGHTAAVQATWDVPPYFQTSEHHGAELTVVLERQRVAVRSRDGETLFGREFSPDRFWRDELAAFAAAIRAPEPPGDQNGTLERHTAVTALLQAVYLSNRTGQPESPLKFYEAQGWPEPRW